MRNRTKFRARLATGKISGFTLIELMVTVAVLAILASVGLASFQRLSAEYRVSSQANATQSLLQFARSEALKRRENVIVCSDNQGLFVRIGADCDGAAWNDAGNLMFVARDARVTFAGFPANGLVYAPNGYLVVFAAVNMDISAPGQAGVDTRRIRLIGSGFSEILRV